MATCLQDDWSSSNEQLQIARDAARASMDHIGPEEWVDRFGNEPRKGADILVQCLEREGAYRCSLLLKFSTPSAPSWLLAFSTVLCTQLAAKNSPKVLCTQLAAGIFQGPLHPAGCWSSPRPSAPSWPSRLIALLEL